MSIPVLTHAPGAMLVLGDVVKKPSPSLTPPIEIPPRLAKPPWKKLAPYPCPAEPWPGHAHPEDFPINGIHYGYQVAFRYTQKNYGTEVENYPITAKLFASDYPCTWLCPYKDNTIELYISMNLDQHPAAWHIETQAAAWIYVSSMTEHGRWPESAIFPDITHEFDGGAILGMKNIVVNYLLVV